MHFAEEKFMFVSTVLQQLYALLCHTVSSLHIAFSNISFSIPHHRPLLSAHFYFMLVFRKCLSPFVHFIFVVSQFSFELLLYKWLHNTPSWKWMVYKELFFTHLYRWIVQHLRICTNRGLRTQNCTNDTHNTLIHLWTHASFGMWISVRVVTGKVLIEFQNWINENCSLCISIFKQHYMA